eukprot:scaffold8013_cov124-Isochrysis_galbana.AAC.4
MVQIVACRGAGALRRCGAARGWRRRLATERRVCRLDTRHTQRHDISATLVQRATAWLEERVGCARADLRTPTL